MSSSKPRAIGLGVVAAVLAAAALLTWTNVRLASSQAISLVAKETSQSVPSDNPLAPVWDTAPQVEIPLSAQNVTVPQGGGGIRTVRVRALHDGGRIYFRLDWDDPTKDTSAFDPQDFRDAAAIEFPANGVTTLPSFCMGQSNARVNIWQWKADWQADIDSGYLDVPQVFPNAVADYYPFQDDNTFYSGRAAGNRFSQTQRTSPVENLVSAGFGTLTSATDQMVQGKGTWQSGRWYVLFSRAMDVGGDTYTPFQDGQKTNVAFAVWEGSNGERDGLKSVSQFADLTVEHVAGAGGGGGGVYDFLPYLGIGALVIILPAAVGALIYRRRKAPAQGAV